LYGTKRTIACRRPARLALTEIADQIEALTRQIDKLERGIRRRGEARRGHAAADHDSGRRSYHGGYCQSAGSGSRRVQIRPSLRRLAGTDAKSPIRAAARSGSAAYRKMGNPTLRSLLVCGATSVLRRVKGNDKAPQWLIGLFGAAAVQVVAVALANKMARIIWRCSPRAGHIEILARQAARRALEPRESQNGLTGADAGQRRGAQLDDDSTGRNPEAREAGATNALTARIIDQPLASRISSRPAVYDRAERPDI